VGLTPRELSCTEDVKLLDFGIGLTDLKKRTVHGDASPPTGEDRARLLQLVDEWKPQIVAFHGAEIARQFFNSYKISCGELRRYDIQEPLKGCEMFVVTSASAANGHYKKQLWSWHDLAKKLRP